MTVRTFPPSTPKFDGVGPTFQSHGLIPEWIQTISNSELSELRQRFEGDVSECRCALLQDPQFDVGVYQAAEGRADQTGIIQRTIERLDQRWLVVGGGMMPVPVHRPDGEDVPGQADPRPFQPVHDSLTPNRMWFFSNFRHHLSIPSETGRGQTNSADRATAGESAKWPGLHP